MLVLNTTFSGASSSKEELITFLQHHYIPMVLSHGTLHSPIIYEIIGNERDSDSFSIALQFSVDALSQLERYQVEHFHQSQQMFINRFGERIVGFITLMRQI